VDRRIPQLLLHRTPKSLRPAPPCCTRRHEAPALRRQEAREGGSLLVPHRG
jgi:hypothetical protein